MSTKCTIAHGKNWHLYEELVDDAVWFSVAGAVFAADNNSVALRLPPDAIDAIRKASPNSFPHCRHKEGGRR